MIMDREQEIRILAHALWEQEGCPEGHDQDHWYRAEVIWALQQSTPAETNGHPLAAVPMSVGAPASEAVASDSIDRRGAPKKTHRRRHRAN
ncbi:MAG: DUF2934 domain-containing protein [Chloroflexi bacterium]|nr:DUF2934 domain-containing protein [Chloroflexota bacterium]